MCMVLRFRQYLTTSRLFFLVRHLIFFVPGELAPFSFSCQLRPVHQIKIKLSGPHSNIIGALEISLLHLYLQLNWYPSIFVISVKTGSHFVELIQLLGRWTRLECSFQQLQSKAVRQDLFLLLLWVWILRHQRLFHLTCRSWTQRAGVQTSVLYKVLLEHENEHLLLARHPRRWWWDSAVLDSLLVVVFC